MPLEPEYGRSPYGERGLKYDVLRLSAIDTSRSPYGERGLKYGVKQVAHGVCSRSPYGERGLKYIVIIYFGCGVRSLSLRRAWIEITCPDNPPESQESRSPYGERGLKYQWATAAGEIRDGRSPYGERGLKSG